MDEDKQRTSKSHDEDRDRSSANHPQERVQDKPMINRMWYHAKRARHDLWLFLISAFCLWSVWLIQESRRDNVIAACEASNNNHDNTIVELKRLTAQRLSGNAPPKGSNPQVVDAALASALADASKEERDQATSSLSTTILLIDKLQPQVDDCDAVADERVGGVF